MNKFGIFNLLNSFLQPTSQKNSSPSENPLTSPDFLNNLFSSFNKPKEQQKESEVNIKSVPLPLQKDMLSTISSHDQIVKRVLQNQTKN